MRNFLAVTTVALSFMFFVVNINSASPKADPPKKEVSKAKGGIKESQDKAKWLRTHSPTPTPITTTTPTFTPTVTPGA